jgi:hypothetical protein
MSADEEDYDMASSEEEEGVRQTRGELSVEDKTAAIAAQRACDGEMMVMEEVKPRGQMRRMLTSVVEEEVETKEMATADSQQQEEEEEGKKEIAVGLGGEEEGWRYHKMEISELATDMLRMDEDGLSVDGMWDESPQMKKMKASLVYGATHGKVVMLSTEERLCRFGDSRGLALFKLWRKIIFNAVDNDHDFLNLESVKGILNSAIKKCNEDNDEWFREFQTKMRGDSFFSKQIIELNNKLGELFVETDLKKGKLTYNEGTSLNDKKAKAGENFFFDLLADFTDNELLRDVRRYKTKEDAIKELQLFPCVLIEDTRVLALKDRPLHHVNDKMHLLDAAPLGTEWLKNKDYNFPGSGKWTLENQELILREDREILHLYIGDERRSVIVRLPALAAVTEEEVVGVFWGELQMCTVNSGMSVDNVSQLQCLSSLLCREHFLPATGRNCTITGIADKARNFFDQTQSLRSSVTEPVYLLCHDVVYKEYNIKFNPAFMVYLFSDEANYPVKTLRIILSILKTAGDKISTILIRKIMEQIEKGMDVVPRGVLTTVDVLCAGEGVLNGALVLSPARGKENVEKIIIQGFPHAWNTNPWTHLMGATQNSMLNFGHLLLRKNLLTSELNSVIGKVEKATKYNTIGLKSGVEMKLGEYEKFLKAIDVAEEEKWKVLYMNEYMSDVAGWRISMKTKLKVLLKITREMNAKRNKVIEMVEQTSEKFLNDKREPGKWEQRFGAPDLISTHVVSKDVKCTSINKSLGANLPITRGWLNSRDMENLRIGKEFFLDCVVEAVDVLKRNGVISKWSRDGDHGVWPPNMTKWIAEKQHGENEEKEGEGIRIGPILSILAEYLYKMGEELEGKLCQPIITLGGNIDEYDMMWWNEEEEQAITIALDWRVNIVDVVVDRSSSGSPPGVDVIYYPCKILSCGEVVEKKCIILKSLVEEKLEERKKVVMNSPYYSMLGSQTVDDMTEKMKDISTDSIASVRSTDYQYSHLATQFNPCIPRYFNFKNEEEISLCFLDLPKFKQILGALKTTPLKLANEFKITLSQKSKRIANLPSEKRQQLALDEIDRQMSEKIILCKFRYDGFIKERLIELSTYGSPDEVIGRVDLLDFCYKLDTGNPKQSRESRTSLKELIKSVYFFIYLDDDKKRNKEPTLSDKYAIITYILNSFEYYSAFRLESKGRKEREAMKGYVVGGYINLIDFLERKLFFLGKELCDMVSPCDILLSDKGRGDFLEDRKSRLKVDFPLSFKVEAVPKNQEKEKRMMILMELVRFEKKLKALSHDNTGELGELVLLRQSWDAALLFRPGYFDVSNKIKGRIKAMLEMVEVKNIDFMSLGLLGGGGHYIGSDDEYPKYGLPTKFQRNTRKKRKYFKKTKNKRRRKKKTKNKKKTRRKKKRRKKKTIKKSRSRKSRRK